MESHELSQLPAGTRVWRWWDSGAFGAVQNEFTLVRTNPKTVTVENNRGDRIRIPHAEIVGVVDWGENE